MKIQCCIKGFSGPPATVYSLYDESSGLIAVNKSVAFRKDRFSDAVIVSNVDMAERDALFEAEHFKDAIDAFFMMFRGGEIKISDSVASSNPEHKIEVDGVRENGRTAYRFSDDVTNGQVAVIASCWYVNRANSITKAIDMQDRLLSILSGDFLTI